MTECDVAAKPAAYSLLPARKITEYAMPTLPQSAATDPLEDCSSGESKAVKRPRRAANAARELVAEVAADDSDSEGADEPPLKAKVAKKTATATPGAGPRPKLPRPEGIACCPRCKSEDTKFCYYNNYNIKQPRFFCKV